MSTENWISLVLAVINILCIGVNIANFRNLKWVGVILISTLNVVAAVVCFHSFLRGVGAL